MIIWKTEESKKTKKGYVPIKLITLVVGVLFALMAFSFINDRVLSYCKFSGCEYIATVAGLMGFVFVLAFFNAELRVFVKSALRF